MTKSWTDIGDADRQAIELVTLDLPVTDAGYRLFGECTAIGQAALLLALDDSALEAWYLAAAPPQGPISRVLSRTADLEEVADRIDATLVEDPSVLADLCRAQITWFHPELVALLDQPSRRISAAWMLSHTEFELLLDWLDGDRTPEELVDVARAVAPSGVPELFDALSPWLGAIREDAPDCAAHLEAALFVLSPQSWGRGFLRGQWDAAFLHDSVAMADILCASGQSYWSGALALFDPASEPFGAIARMIVAGAAANLHFGIDDPPPAIVNAFYVEDWPTLMAHPAFAIACTLAEEESWQQVLLESAVHDVLGARGIESPGLGGLPLSSSHPDAEEIATALQMRDRTDVDPIAAVATICDLLELRALPEFAALPAAFAPLARHDDPAIASAAQLLVSDTELAADIELAGGETVAAFAAAERIARRGTPDAIRALIDLWADGPVLRANFLSTLLHQEIRAIQLGIPEL